MAGARYFGVFPSQKESGFSMKQKFFAICAFIAVLGIGTSAWATPINGVLSTFGNTTGGGPYDLTSNGTSLYTDITYSGLAFNVTDLVTFGQLTNLSLDYDTVEGGLGGGALREELYFSSTGGTTADEFMAVLLGPAGSFVDPTLGSANSGNLIAMDDVGRYDLSGSGGSGYTTYDAALALAGSWRLLEVDTVDDNGWFFSDDPEDIATSEFTIPAGGGLDLEGDIVATPEPASMLLLGTGLVGLAGVVRKKFHRS